MAIVGSARPLETRIVLDETFRRKYVSTYEVISDDKTDGPGLILQAPGLPEFASSYSWYNTTDEYAFCDGATANFRELKESRLLWSVAVTHSSPKYEGSASSNTRDNTQRPENPILEPIQISGSFAQFRKPVEKDIDGKPIENGAFEPFVPAYEVDDSRDTLIVTMNTAKINFAKRAKFRDSVNRDPIWGLQKHQWKLAQWRYSLRYYGKGQKYIHNELEFHASNAEDENGNIVGWSPIVVLNEGFRRRKTPPVGSEPNPRKWTEEILIKGERPTRPVKLDTTGFPLGELEQDPNYLRFPVYRERDFTELGIPNPLPGPFE